MMKCETMDSIAAAWEEGTTRPDDLELFRTHLESCSDCQRRFGALLPLMLREGNARPATAPAGITDDVMAALGRRDRRRFVFSPILAAAAAVIFVVGLGLGIFFAQRNVDMVTVTFLLDAPQASSVYLAGDFNDWNGKGYKMRRVGSDGTWKIMIPLKRDKVYVYNFVIDGKTWIADPAIPVKIDDGFGGSGSLLRL